jgi:GTPase KRas protein
VLDGFKTGLDLLDTAGQEEYKALRDSYMRNYQSFIFLFSVTSRQSFNEVQEWVEQVRRVKDTKNVPIILSANKIDLVNDRVVTTQEGEELAKALDVEYFEVSAKDREACTELYYKAARMARDTMTEVHELWETLEKGKIPSIKSAKKKCNVM